MLFNNFDECSPNCILYSDVHCTMYIFFLDYTKSLQSLEQNLIEKNVCFFQIPESFDSYFHCATDTHVTL